MAGKIRLHELAKELGLTNKETLDLSQMLGIGVKSHSSSIEEAQADRVRRRAERDGLKRDVQPEEPTKKAGGRRPAGGSAPAEVASPEPVSVPDAPAPLAPAASAPASPTAPDAPAPLAPAASAPAPTPAAPAPVAPAEPATPPVVVPAAAASVVLTPSAPVEPREVVPPAEGEGEHRKVRSRPDVGDGAGAPTRATPPPPPRRVPPPPGRPEAPPATRSAPPRPVDPAGGARPGERQPFPEQPAARTGAPGAPRPGAGAPSAPPRPAAPSRPGAPDPSGGPGAPPRPGGPPSGAPSAPRPGAPGGPSAPPRSGPGSRPAPPPGSSIPAPPRPPTSPSGGRIPPPPGRPPTSLSGAKIPPPPGPRGAVQRAATPPPSSARGPRPAGGGFANRPGGPRPGGGPGGGGFGRGPGGGPRPGGGPGGGGPGGGFSRPGGGGPRPSGGRRAPKRRGRRRSNLEELQPQTMAAYSPTNAPVPDGTIVVERSSTAQDFAPKLNRTSADVVRFLLTAGEMVTATMSLTDEQMELFALEVGADVLLVDPGQQQELELQALFNDADDDDPDLQDGRAPVITIMGHVDHGKTLLLDRIRSTNVVAGEAGGITQHIGAYQVSLEDRPITFIDTPGHEAFTKMRARGADATDIVVLVVAADDGVMPQTVEAINHAKAAEVPIVVALNKIDRENADPQRVLSQLSEQQLVPESWGGDTIVVEMSALQNIGVDDLLEQLLVVAELEELTANPQGRAKGIVLEANLDVGRGPVATILVDKGTLEVGDPIVAGSAWGSVRALIDDQGEQIKSAGPSTPVQVLGLSSVPGAGDEFRVAPDLKTAKTVGEAREQTQRLRAQRGDARVQRGVRLEDIFDQIQKGEAATLNLVLKADVQGSLEALTESLRRLEREEVKLAFVHRAVGGISENDITLAATTNATIIGFNVRPDRKARELADAEDVEVRTYEIIYQVLEDIEKAMVGLLAPEYEEVVTGDAEVREIFSVPRIGRIAGCYVTNGSITRGSKVRFLREGVVIWKGAISSLRRFKEDVREVREGFECGIGLTDFQDLKQGDVIETYEDREIPRT